MKKLKSSGKPGFTYDEFMFDCAHCGSTQVRQIALAYEDIGVIGKCFLCKETIALVHNSDIGIIECKKYPLV